MAVSFALQLASALSTRTAPSTSEDFINSDFIALLERTCVEGTGQHLLDAEEVALRHISIAHVCRLWGPTTLHFLA
jgi:hypothetical protein